LTSALEGSNFDIPHINILNTLAQVGDTDRRALLILKYGYLGALVACFIFGMGNRPQG